MPDNSARDSLSRSPEEQRRRQAIWEQMRALQTRVAVRSTDLTEEDVEVLADDISREVLAALINQGRVRFSQ